MKRDTTEDPEEQDYDDEVVVLPGPFGFIDDATQLTLTQINRNSGKILNHLFDDAL